MSFFQHGLPWPVLPGTTQDYNNLLQITISHDVTATPSWYVTKELASQAKAGESETSLGSFPRVFSPEAGPCAVHNLVNQTRGQAKAELPLINFQTFQHLRATQQLGRNFQKAIMDAKSNDDERFKVLKLSLLSSLSYLREVHAKLYN